MVTLKYFQEKFLSIGKASELSGMSKWDFIEYLSDNNIPVIDYDDDEISRELETAENIVKQKQGKAQKTASLNFCTPDS
ncbi:UPF0175 family protein [Desulfococcaceae bacterium HSG8]|nr:UPF0175 family protein [Desulfococcaceae bacterium HSG8]